MEGAGWAANVVLAAPPHLVMSNCGEKLLKPRLEPPLTSDSSGMLLAPHLNSREQGVADRRQLLG